MKERFRESLPDGRSYNVLNIDDQLFRQHLGLYRAGGAFLLHGRQP
jgi:hypothetical protein